MLRLADEGYLVLTNLPRKTIGNMEYIIIIDVLCLGPIYGHRLVGKSARTTMTRSKRLGKPSTKNGNCATTLTTMATGHRSEHAGDS